MREDADTADQETAGPATRGDNADHAWSHAFEPAAGERRSEAEADNRHREDPDDVFERPIRGCARHNAVNFD